MSDWEIRLTIFRRRLGNWDCPFHADNYIINQNNAPADFMLSFDLTKHDHFNQS